MGKFDCAFDLCMISLFSFFDSLFLLLGFSFMGPSSSDNSITSDVQFPLASDLISFAITCYYVDEFIVTVLMPLDCYPFAFCWMSGVTCC